MPRSMHLVRAAGAAALLLVSLGAAPASATVTGGCQVSGTSTSGAIDLTTAAEWHLKKADSAGGSGTAPSEQTQASVSVYAFGLALPIAGGTGDGKTEGAAGPYAVEPYANIARVWVVGGSSTSCSGQVKVIIDDVNPLLTLMGGGALVLAVLAILLLLWMATKDAAVGRRIVGLVIGLLGGIGAGLALMQVEVLDPAAILGLIVPLIGALLGLLLPGLFHREPKEA